MIESEELLGDDFWTEEELYKMAVDQIDTPRYEDKKLNICIYHLYKNAIDTGLVLITTVKSVVDGQNAIDKLWADAGILSIAGEYSEESEVSKYKLEAIYTVLEKYAYKGKMKLIGSDRVFRYEKWMDNLVN